MRLLNIRCKKIKEQRNVKRGITFEYGAVCFIRSRENECGNNLSNKEPPTEIGWCTMSTPMHKTTHSKHHLTRKNRSEKRNNIKSEERPHHNPGHTFTWRGGGGRCPHLKYSKHPLGEML
ncbi:hypothetical protein JTE90_023162 [Oedothorax gibbosus]|uniref:Uncharacterized protein n=1 Tax=Oedothorax gibbosus TaxID=931172 RepID=A0AAV6US88_9ARAC|nr:hypothetical protein JTE90_023162 [Oedothorax gibbosus]